MLKIKMRDMPVITLHINQSDKAALQEKASKKGMLLATYCRVVLLKELEKGK